MKLFSRGVLFLAVFGLLPVITGCSSVEVNSVGLTQQKVEAYNTLVAHTLADYAQAKLVAQSENSSVLSFLSQDIASSAVAKVASSVQPLTPKELTLFKYYTVVYQGYFTALGASGVREVVVLASKNKRLYGTMLWNSQGLYALSRVVLAQ